MKAKTMTTGSMGAAALLAAVLAMAGAPAGAVDIGAAAPALQLPGLAGPVDSAAL